MAATKKAVSFTIWQTKRTHEDDPSIAPNDWRDPDVCVALDGATVYTEDENSVRADVDWEQGWWLQRGDRQIGVAGKGDPPAFIRTAYEKGLVLFGVIILRDLQRHG